MKHTLFLLCVCLLAGYSTFGQTTAGTNFIGGTINLRSTDRTNSPNEYASENRNRSFSIEGGHFLKENLALGIQWNYNFGNSHYESRFQNIIFLSDSEYNGMSAAIFLRYYKPLAEKFFFTTQGGMGGFSNKSEGTYSRNGLVTDKFKNQANGAFLNISPGFSYFPANWFELNVALGGLSYYFTHNITNNVNSHSVNLNASLTDLSYGFRFYF